MICGNKIPPGESGTSDGRLGFLDRAASVGYRGHGEGGNSQSIPFPGQGCGSPGMEARLHAGGGARWSNTRCPVSRTAPSWQCSPAPSAAQNVISSFGQRSASKMRRGRRGRTVVLRVKDQGGAGDPVGDSLHGVGAHLPQRLCGAFHTEGPPRVARRPAQVRAVGGGLRHGDVGFRVAALVDQGGQGRGQAAPHRGAEVEQPVIEHERRDPVLEGRRPPARRGSPPKLVPIRIIRRSSTSGRAAA